MRVRRSQRHVNRVRRTLLRRGLYLSGSGRIDPAEPDFGLYRVIAPGGVVITKGCPEELEDWLAATSSNGRAYCRPEAKEALVPWAICRGYGKTRAGLEVRA